MDLSGLFAIGVAVALVWLFIKVLTTKITPTSTQSKRKGNNDNYRRKQYGKLTETQAKNELDKLMKR